MRAPDLTKNCQKLPVSLTDLHTYTGGYVLVGLRVFLIKYKDKWTRFQAICEQSD